MLATVQGNLISVSAVVSDFSLYGENLENSIEFFTELSIDLILDRFGVCFYEFCESEKMDFDNNFYGFPELEEFKELGFPLLGELLINHARLARSIIIKHLLVDFSGFVFKPNSQNYMYKKHYIIRCIKDLVINPSSVRLIGLVTEHCPAESA